MYFTEDRKPLAFGFTELSEEWTEPTLHERFAGFPISCHPYRGILQADRACAVFVKSHNEVPALFLSFFFSAGRLNEAVVNIPWWSHGSAYHSLTATFGQPAASQFFPHHGVRLHGWRLANGAALFLNRDRTLNPFSWNAIYWRSSAACGTSGCIQKNEP